jgi:phenylacetic acid degradation operon negative regulatory protein
MQRPTAATAYLGYVFGALGAESVPGPCLIDLLLDLGMSESAVRTMLSRQNRAGQLSSSHHGRVAVYRLEGSYRERFLRIRQGDEPVSWPGGFQLIMYDIAESRRRDRDALRERAAAVGFGAPRPGVLIGFSDPAEWARPWLERDDLFVRAGELRCTLETACELAERTWRLRDAAPRIGAFVKRLQQLRQRDVHHPASQLKAFRMFADVMRDYAGLSASTPTLPIEITPQDWLGRELSTALREVSTLLGPRVSAHASETAERRNLTHLVQPLTEG